MKHVGIKQAREALPDLVHRAEAGEEIVITRQGRPVARLVGVSFEPRPFPPLSEAAESALLAMREPCISTLTEVEFASLIARKRRLRARDLIATPRSPLHTLDALHLAAALTIDVPLLTADQLRARAARQHGARIILVR